MTAEEAEAVHTAAKAFGATHLYSWRLMATTRQEVQIGSTEAVDLTDLRRVIIEDILDEGSRSRFDIEGDEILYIDAVDDDHVDQEIDMRQKGEPFSWSACELVKEIAALTEGDVGCDKLRQLIAKAQKLLPENEDAGKAGRESAEGHRQDAGAADGVPATQVTG